MSKLPIGIDIDVCYGGTYPEKNGKTRMYSQSFQARFLILLQQINFCEFDPVNVNLEF